MRACVRVPTCVYFPPISFPHPTQASGGGGLGLYLPEGTWARENLLDGPRVGGRVRGRVKIHHILSFPPLSTPYTFPFRGSGPGDIRSGEPGVRGPLGKMGISGTCWLDNRAGNLCAGKKLLRTFCRGGRRAG